MRLSAGAGNRLESMAPVLEAMAIVDKDYPPNYINRWTALFSGIVIFEAAQQFKDAEGPARELLPILDANHAAENDPRRAQSLFLLGTALHGEHKDGEAADVLEKAATIYDAGGPSQAKYAVQARKMESEAHSKHRGPTTLGH